jgi:hypothetical protein
MRLPNRIGPFSLVAQNVAGCSSAACRGGILRNVIGRAVPGVIVGMLILGSVASATGRGTLRGPDSATAGTPVGVLGQPTQHRHRQRHRWTCTGACRQLEIGQGDGGGPACGSAQLIDQGTAKQPSKTFTFGSSDPIPNTESEPYFDTPPGDLLLAALMTDGVAVTPPPGWTEVTPADQSYVMSGRLQLFYRIPAPLNVSGDRSEKYTFTSLLPQMISGELVELTGARQFDPVESASGEANSTPSLRVTASSLTPASATTRLIFIGAAGLSRRWKAPPAMTIIGDPYDFPGPSRIRSADQWWLSARPTGTRTASISASAKSIGDLIAVAYPRPITCPTLRVVNRPQRVPPDRYGSPTRDQVLELSSNGRIAVRLKCEWSVRCIGGFGVGTSPIAAAGNFSLPPHQSRTVQITWCRSGSRCPQGGGNLPRHSEFALVDDAVVRLPNGQFADTPVEGGPGELLLKVP